MNSPLMPEAKVTLVGGVMPEYKTAHSAGFDISVAESGAVRPGQVKLFRTGLIIQPPPGYFTAIFARSSLQKRGLMLANNVGIIDPDYCGPDDEILVALFNFGDSQVVVNQGERVAQGLFLPFTQVNFVRAYADGQNRGGFGSTGL